jgi:O-antigen ligase
MHTSPTNTVEARLHSSGRMSVTDFQRRDRRQAAWISIWLLASTASIALLFAYIGNLAVWAGFIVPIGVLLMWLWQRPVLGLYILFGAAVTLEAEYNHAVTGNWVAVWFPFFVDLRSWLPHSGVATSIAELFMITAVLVWLLKAIATRSLTFYAGTLKWPIFLYTLALAIGLAHGLTSGGDFKTALWEIRPQIYMIVAYILTCNFIKRQSQIYALLWILMIGTGLKTLDGTLRYLYMKSTRPFGLMLMFSHEQAFFLNAFIVLTVLAFLFGWPRRFKAVALLFLPFVVFCDFALERRAGTLALAVGLAAVLIITFIIYPRRRRGVGLVILLLIVTLPPYYETFKNSYQTIAQPARAFQSQFQPTARDLSSNTYRINEDKDILATMRTSPIIGYGFGKPMGLPYPLANISSIYPFWNILPHNSILWIWMRMGTFGYTIFWFLVGLAIRQAMELAQKLKDDRLRVVAIFVGVMVAQQVILGYLDLQWSNYRNMIAIGVLFGVLSALTTISRADECAVDGSGGVVAIRRRGLKGSAIGGLASEIHAGP